MYNDLNDTSNFITQPDKLNLELMEHQKRAVWAMLDFEKNGKINCKYKYFDNNDDEFIIESQIGILGDKVGSGKTYMILSVICSNDNPQDVSPCYSSKNFIKLIQNNQTITKVKTNVICVPHTLISQWDDAIKKLDSKMLCVTINDAKSLGSFDKACNYTIALVSSNMFGKFIDLHKNVKWNRLFIDEADSIKIECNKLMANFIWLVTGTPSGIAYSKSKYINNIFGDYKQWLTDFITVRNNNKFIDESLKLPKPKKIMIKCYTPIELKLVKDFIPQHIISMINAGNTDEAIKSLNCHKDTTENIFSVVSKNVRAAIHNKNIELKAEKEKKYVSQQALQEQDLRIKKIEKILNRLTSRLKALKDKFDEMSSEICAVCMGDITNPTILDCCGHGFCFDCIASFMNAKSKCPCCMKTISKSNLHVVKTTKNDNDNENKTKMIIAKEKMENLLEILSTKEKEKKFLVFANYPATFKKIEENLLEKKITYGILKGTENAVNKTIEDFKAGKKIVLMLNAKNFGAGMNLQMASDIVIYHRFTKEMEEQIIGRAQRIGREGQLNVHYLIHDNESGAIETSFDFDETNYELFEENDDNNELNNSKANNVTKNILLN